MTKQELKIKLLNTHYFIDNNYLDEYVDLIITNISSSSQGYSEKHHILQKQYFRLTNTPIDNSDSNLVLLLYKDHCKAHWLLYYCTIGHLKRANAASVNYILKVYNNLHKTLKTKEEISDKIFNELQFYYDNIRNDESSKYYTDYEITFIKDNYSKHGADYCAKQLNRSLASIRNEVYTLGLLREWTWTDEMNNLLYNQYKNVGGKVCAKKLNLPLKAIYKQAKKLGLSRKGTPKIKDDSWTSHELNLLIQWYPLEGTKAYLRIPTRSYNACRLKASQLGLKKLKKEN